MAVGDSVYDGSNPPPLLTMALNYEHWGVGDIMKLPPGLLPQFNNALGYYRALQGYRAAQKTGEWARRHPDAWNLVSWYLAQRMERNRGNRN